MGIPIPDLLMQLRRAAKHDADAGHLPLVGQARARDWKELLAWKAWAWLSERPALYRTAIQLGRWLRPVTPPWQGGWTAHRTPLQLARHGLRSRLADR